MRGRVGGDTPGFCGIGDARAQSSPLGYVLVLAVMIAGATLVVAMGGQAFADTQGQLQLENSQNTMTQFDSQVALVALGNSNAQEVAVGGTNGFQVHNQSGSVTIEYKNYETGGTEQIIDDQPLGAVTTEANDQTVAYQGGGVWRHADNGTRMVSAPEFHYRNATLTFPLVTVRGDAAVDQRTGVSDNGTVTYYPNSSLGHENPLSDGKVWVTIQSEYYKGWGEYFETRTEGDVEYDHANEEVTATLVIPANYPSLDAGVISGAPGSTMTINNNAVIDSYNSSKGTYSSSSGEDSKIRLAGDLVIQNADVYGDVEVDGTVDFGHNNGRLHDGNISYGEAVEYSKSESHHWPAADGSTYWKAQNASVESPDSVQGLINSKRTALEDPANNDNDDEDTIGTDDKIDCSSSCTITSGSYYLEELSVTDELELDTSGGNIHIVVDGPVNLNENVEVTGDNRVNVYVEEHGSFTNNVEVENANDDATQFWLYMNPDKTLTMNQNAKLRGVVFGPGSGGAPGTDLHMGQNVHVYGALVGHIPYQLENVEIHYDEALANADTVEDDTSLPALTYLHISENRVNVTSG